MQKLKTKNPFAQFLTYLIFPASVILFVYIITESGLVAEFLIPKPIDVLRAFTDNPIDLLYASLQTLSASFIGLLLSFISGTLSALLLYSVPWARKTVFPYAVLFQTVPIVAIAPLLVIWFGYGLNTVIVSSWIVSVFPMITNTLAGFDSVSKNQIDLFKVYNASRSDIFFKLRLPASVPHILTGLKISSGLAVVGSVVGEFISGTGLGALIDSARMQQRIDLVFASVLASSLIGVLMIFLLHLLARLTQRNQSTPESRTR